MFSRAGELQTLYAVVHIAFIPVSPFQLPNPCKSTNSVFCRMPTLTLASGNMLISMRRKAAMLLFTFVSVCAISGQEPALSRVVLRDADAIVIGTLVADFRFPWIDGWNERGHIVVEQVLSGSVNSSTLPFSWERDFKQGWCLTRPDSRGAIGKRGIWVLTRDGSRYRAPDLLTGFRDVKDLGSVMEALSDTRRSAGSPSQEGTVRATVG